MQGKTTTLCVRRATYWDDEMKADDPAKKGVCSNFLCDTKPGDEVMLTGPAGKVMLMPEKNPATDLIMVATGTGIAPYRCEAFTCSYSCHTTACQHLHNISRLNRT